MYKMKKSLAVAFIFMTPYCYGVIQIYEDHEAEVKHCVAKIIQRIELVNTTNVALINVSDSLAQELNSLSEPHLSFISRSFDWPNDTVLYGMYVMQCMNSSMLLRELNLLKRDPFWNPRAKFVIIIKNIEYSLQDISSLLLNMLIHDVALVVSDEVYTFGLERDECDRPVFNVLRLLSSCSQVQNIEIVYVAARKTSLRGCRVKFVGDNYWPYMRFHGIGYRPTIHEDIFELMAEIEHITIEAVESTTAKELNTLHLDNITSTRTLHEVEIGNVEGAVGSYALNLKHANNLDFVYPILVYYYTIITTRAELLDNWSAVLKLLGAATLWCLLGTFSIVCIIVVSVGMFKGRADTSRDVLSMWGYFFNNIPQKHIKTGIPYRLLLWNILLFAFIISSATQGCIFSAITKPVHGYQPDTLEEVNSSFQLVMSPFAIDFLNTHPDMKFSNVYNNSCKTTTWCNWMVKVGQTPLYTLSSSVSDKMRFWLYSEKNIHTLREPMGARQLTMYLRRGSSLVEPLNRLILRARSAGLIDRRLDRLLYENNLYYEYHYYLPDPLKKKPLTLKSFKGVFLILISGYCLSTIIFVIEISHKK